MLSKNIVRSGALAALLVLSSACMHRSGSYVWVDRLPGLASDSSSVSSEYVIAPGDLIGVTVFEHTEMSGRVRVRDDGRVSLPLLNEVSVAGLTPAQLSRKLEGAMKENQLVVAPSVTVSLEERRALRVAVLGEVARPGMYQLESGAGVAEALASAGGFTDFAHKDRIYVVRKMPQQVRIRFSYDAIVAGRGRAASFRLLPGDVVVSE